MKKKRVAFLTLGCKVNSYETDAMQKLFEDAGYEMVSFQEDAEVYIINTCTVTNIADRKSRQMLHRARKLHPSAVVVAAGCYVQTAQQEAAADPAVDIVVGNNKKAEIVTIVENYQKQKNKHQQKEHQKDDAHQQNQQSQQHQQTQALNTAKSSETAETHVEDVSLQKEYERLFITGTGERTRASIKIQDGCNQFCSYCIIPYARGRIRSRTLLDIRQEVTGLAKAGYQEIVLTGIHLSSYGMDFVKEGEQPKPRLLEVIEELSKIEGIKRIRLGSLEPNIITEDFVEALAGNPKVCPHFHLSLQSGCNETLKRMNRHYTAEEYLEKCRLLRRYFEQPAITTDVITGFPGETEEEFEESRNFLEQAAFSQMHIFPYSRRHGTKAEHMPNQVPEERKKQRSEILLALEQKMRHNYQGQFIGTMQQMLLEEKILLEGNFYWVGHTMRYIRVAVPVWDQENHSNHLITGKIKGRLGEDLLLCSAICLPVDSPKGLPSILV